MPATPRPTAPGPASAGRSGFPCASTQRVVAPLPDASVQAISRVPSPGRENTERIGDDVSGSENDRQETESNHTKPCRAVRAPNGRYAAANPESVGAASVHAASVVCWVPSREKISFQPWSPVPSRQTTATSPRPSLIAPAEPQHVVDG